ncbi:hypothetical protein DAPPUDRAFT_248795 [Daphnia pulex]|uniref:JmjC domain-containing protein n=1 Tax=Daphnia pulex TaxID=6669 RepID=E9GV86_DAPPU|nr:hypothetical protein DAPPUDRAFT_248795 [Daphnia pulex]|eukprot:EFX76654.1 hypothetical protein DAPPUDRAFT_248795 [Daphnia pulex]
MSIKSKDGDPAARPLKQEYRKPAQGVYKIQMVPSEKGIGLAPNKPIPEYLVDKNASLFVSSKFEGIFYSLLERSYNRDVWCKCPPTTDWAGTKLHGLARGNINLASVNFLHDGKPKYWIIIPARHKSFFVMPQVLRAAEPPIPFDCIKQEEGHICRDIPSAFHMLVNIGSNCAEAINVCLPEWEDYANLPECI